MRTLALYWPALSSGAGSATDDRAVRLRSARHALGHQATISSGEAIEMETKSKDCSLDSFGVNSGVCSGWIMSVRAGD